MGCAQSDLTVDGEALAAERSNIDPQETADLDVYVSTLSSPVAETTTAKLSVADWW